MYKYKLLMLFIAFLIAGKVLPQINSDWISRHTGSMNMDEARAIVLDASNNVYVTGRSMNTGAGYDIVTVKYNTAGVMQWTATYNASGGRDEGNDIAFDGTNIYVTGVTTGSLGTGLDYVTIKYNASTGAVIWTSVYNGPANLDDIAVKVAAKNNRVYVTGKGFYSGTSSDYVTIKYNATTGDSIWVRNYDGTGGGNDSATFIKVSTRDSSVYVTGKSFGASNYDIATIKYNYAGTQNWAKRHNGTANGNDIGISISFNDAVSNPDVYVTGNALNTGTGLDIVSFEYSSSGVENWIRTKNGTSNGNDEAVSVVFRSTTEIFVAGNVINTGSGSDYSLTKYNGSGTELFYESYNGNANGADSVKSMATDASGYSYLAGVSAETSGGRNYNVLKYSPAGNMEWNFSYNHSATGSDVPSAVTVDATTDRNVYVTGASFSGTSGTNYATLKLKQHKVLDLNMFVQGFYNPVSNTIIKDTVRVMIYNSAATTIIDSGKVYFDSLGKGRLYFRAVANGTSYRLAIKHRNSIETWGSSTNSFSNLYLTYDFTNAVTKAYGSNQIQVDASPVEYAIYGGDVNQDNAVDISDIVKVFNDANIFLSGYVSSDVNGDSYVDVSDLVLTFNNSNDFISTIRP